MERPKCLSASCKAGNHANKANLNPAFSAVAQEKSGPSTSNGNDQKSSQGDVKEENQQGSPD